MKRKIMKTLAIGVAIVMMVSSLAGCGKSADSNASLTGKISIAGSTSMEKLCEAMSESFMEAYPDITVTVEYTGSGAGIESLTQGSIDIGNASRGLKDGEKEQGAVENIVAIDGIAVITDKANTVADLTSEQLASILEMLPTGASLAAVMRQLLSSVARQVPVPEALLRNCLR